MHWMALFQNTLQTARSDAARGTADAVEDIDKLFQGNYCNDGATVWRESCWAFLSYFSCWNIYS